MGHRRLRQMVGMMLVVLFLVGCGADATTPVPEAPAATEALGQAAPAASNTPAPAAATNTPESLSPDALLETATSLCDKVFSAYDIETPLVSGAATAPILTLRAIGKGDQDPRPEDAPWTWEAYSAVDAVEATSAETVQAIACIIETRKQTGTYDNNSPAYRPSWHVRLVQWPDGNLFGTEYFIGGDPPKQIPANQSAGVGKPPVQDLSKWLLSVTDDKAIAHPGAVEGVGFSPDGQLLVVGGGWTVRFWDLAAGQGAGSLFAEGSVKNVVYSPDGQTMMSSGYESIRFWDVATGDRTSPIAGIETGMTADYSPDGKMLAVGVDRAVRLFDVETGEEIKLIAEGKYTSKIRFSQDGQVLAVKLDEEVEIWEVETGELRGSLKEGGAKVNDIAISPDGTTIAVAFRSGMVRRWDLETGKVVTTKEIIGGRSAMFAVAYSPDGKFLATGDANNEVGLWEAATGKLIATYQGHSDSVYSVAFSPDGQLLASGSNDGTVRIWEVEE